MQVVPQLASERSTCWEGPHWGASKGPLAGEATSAVPDAPAWGSGGPCSKEEEVVLTDFGVSMSPTAEAAGALGGGGLVGPPSAAWECSAAFAAVAAVGKLQQRRSCAPQPPHSRLSSPSALLKAATAASVHAYRVDRLDQWTRSNLSSSPNDMLSNQAAAAAASVSIHLEDAARKV
ncbi:hypothetical protein Emag_004113 [Eimeria magna]